MFTGSCLNVSLFLYSFYRNGVLRCNFVKQDTVIFFKTSCMWKQLLMLLLVVAAIKPLHAQYYQTAIGLRLSSNDAVVNNGVSVKHFINKIVALEGLISVDPAAFGMLAEVHQPLSSIPGLRWLYGGGGFVSFKDGPSLGAQGILGLDYKFINIPLNLTIDWKPELGLTDAFRFEPAAVGITARFTLR